MRTTARLVAAAAVCCLGLLSSAAGAQDVQDIINWGCEGAHSHANGCFLTNIRGPGGPGDLARGSKVGRACGWSLLGLISVGDVRIETAMKDAGISEVSSVDYDTFQLLPFFYGYNRFCTVVTGD